eukprot:TRINITY_DN4205_c0_g1_i2.p1 TRINITY_DN4205_c0_g1~~TRINITY_DN4205_c0_g1_i2.p1  ORF type:complete len:108 (+),score=28.70 TRINITY_DN4205_c0_g1_i2:67-390(+)
MSDVQASMEEPKKRGRGRPKKDVASHADSETKETHESKDVGDEDPSQEPPAKKTRGRPKQDPEAKDVPAKKRGRPPKKNKKAAAAPVPAAPNAEKRKRGRPPKASTA